MRALRRCAIRCAIGSSQEVPVRDVAARVMGAYEQGGKCQTVELNSNLTPEILKTCREDTSAPAPRKEPPLVHVYGLETRLFAMQ